VPIAQSLMAAYQVLTLGDAAAWTGANDNSAWSERPFCMNDNDDALYAQKVV
jgi:hypothetical protein